MTLTELRKLLKKADPEIRSAALVHLAKTLPKEYRELVGLTVAALESGTPPPPAGSVIPDTKKIKAWLDRSENSLLHAYWRISPKRLRKCLTDLKAHVEHCFACPVQSDEGPMCTFLLQELFFFAWQLEHRVLPDTMSVGTKLKMGAAPYYGKWLSRLFSEGYEKKRLWAALAFCLDTAYDSPELCAALLEVLLTHLKNGDLRMECLDLLEEKLPEADRARQAVLSFLLSGFAISELGEKEAPSWLDGVKGYDPDAAAAFRRSVRPERTARFQTDW